MEDELKVLAVIRKRLESAGYGVLTATDGEEALEVAKAEKPDLILLDLMLPKVDGFAVCQELKHDPKYQHIPILMLTARDQEKDIQRGMTLGADAYMTKPFDHRMLLDRISEMLDRAERNAAIQADQKVSPPQTNRD